MTAVHHCDCTKCHRTVRFNVANFTSMKMKEEKNKAQLPKNTPRPTHGPNGTEPKIRSRGEGLEDGVRLAARAEHHPPAPPCARTHSGLARTLAGLPPPGAVGSGLHPSPQPIYLPASWAAGHWGPGAPSAPRTLPLTRAFKTRYVFIVQLLTHKHQRDFTHVQTQK